ncbi:dihydrolipoamide acetyltransferase family protein [Halorubrum luteum]
MPIEQFTLPDVGEGVAEGELVRWLVSPGDRVEEDQPVAEVETDKALVEVPSRYDGVVEELFAEEGEIVPVGDVIISFRVDEEGTAEAESPSEAGTGVSPSEDAQSSTVEAESSTTDSEPPVPPGRTFAPPSVRRLARELGVDLDAVAGSGVGGRVSEADIRSAADGVDRKTTDEVDEPGTSTDSGPKPVDIDGADRRSAVSKRGETDAAASARGSEPAGRDRTLATPATRKVARDLGVEIDDVPTDASREGEAFVTAEHVRTYAEGETAKADDDVAAAGDEASPAGSSDEAAATIPYRGVRRTIGERMEQSKFTAPHVTHHDTAEVDALVEARERLKPKADAKGVKLTYMPFVMKAVVAGLEEYPVLNSELREDDEEILLQPEYNLGVAVATDAGLMVPVVENVDEKGLFELAEEVHDLASRARDRTLTPAEMSGGTFSITNFGAIGGEYATPIINYPETAILGLGAIEERPVVRSHADVDDGFLDDEEGTTVVPAPTLPLSLTIDHRVVDGAEAASFANAVMDHLENPLLLLSE